MAFVPQIELTATASAGRAPHFRAQALTHVRGSALSMAAVAPAHEASSPSMMDTSAEDEISKHFPSVVDPALLTRLNQLCRTHKMSAGEGVLGALPPLQEALAAAALRRTRGRTTTHAPTATGAAPGTTVRVVWNVS